MSNQIRSLPFKRKKHESFTTYNNAPKRNKKPMYYDHFYAYLFYNLCVIII